MTVESSSVRNIYDAGILDTTSRRNTKKLVSFFSLPASELRSLRHLFDPLPLGSRELDLRRCHVFLQMRNRRSARDRQHHRRSLEEPGQRKLIDRDAGPFRFRCERTVWLGKRTSASADGRPRDKAELLLFAKGERLFRFAVDDVVLVLDADNRQNVSLVLDLL